METQKATISVNNEIKKSLRNIIALFGGKSDILSIIDEWDIENPTPEALKKLRNYGACRIDEVKSKILEDEERLNLCTTIKVLVS